ncbi:carbamoyl-phosphate synthase arginine-specific small chain [Marinithermofilum abyssi]|uniref:Carbamoyl phosphate synthase small chain n=1 Tax=Marinithermofilum abyssi TaxID=1571185 RepID=A0A8J2Y8I6_9BACL|nr:carbamoyl phosphate synthase small subunit [Marinithermofilum abyssi]GGE04669.1 carbamoyl-phosphate synthase arginine-specific small chain [Marinithermofilum abyssi]
MKAYLVFEDGEVFPGEWIGSPREVPGEVVFTTGMTGYQEVVSDPSYAGQIVTFTYPLIGNYSTVPGEEESDAPQCAGVVMSELFEGDPHLKTWLDRHGVPGITGVDTRSVVKKVRTQGAVRGVIRSVPEPWSAEWPDPLSLEWVHRVSVKEPVTYQGKSPEALHVVLVDFGYKKSIREALLEAGCRVTVVPYTTDPATLAEMKPDGLLLSNGPGDPKALLPFLSGWQSLIGQIPTMGICLGHQLLALALGGDTERLPFGHRGSNHPVKELTTGRVMITSQNHGYAVKADSLNPKEWQITHKNINDGSVEGIMHRNLPVTAVQFHPEAHPGPSDAAFLFERFVKQMTEAKEVVMHG